MRKGKETDRNLPKGYEGWPVTNEEPIVFCNRFSCLTPGLDWTRLFMSLTAGAGTRCMSLLPDSPTLRLVICGRLRGGRD